MNEEEILSLAREKFELAADHERDFRLEGLDDLKFARLGEQWPQKVKEDREKDYRPCLTINKMPAFIRQVVNDVRQNKPAIVVHPADDNADPETAEIINGLIRNIQVTSDADVATDTAAESAISNGFGYFRINLTDDGQDIAFERISNPFAVYGDPHSESADSSDWDCAFVVSMLAKDKFAAKYKDAAQVDWEDDGYLTLQEPWREDERIMVAEYWHREAVTIRTIKLSDGSEIEAEDADLIPYLLRGIQPVGEGELRTHKVTQYILTGAEVLETNDWPGSYIPIVPVYGDEINVEGKRYFRSLIHNAKDAQRMFNYWRTMATELIALAPKAPFIGEEGAFDIDPRWSTANSVTHPFLEYAKGSPMPQRQPFDGVPAGALQEALNASDDMKAIIGMYDASLGARSNETSGVAINARRREGDVSTFHFIDNLSRAIRHAGRILIDLIPKIYNRERVIRVLGEDMKPQNVKIGPQDPMAAPQGEMGEEQGGDIQSQIDRLYDLSAGKYDLVVKAGPNYSTLREETRAEMVEVIRSYPNAAPVLGPMILRQSDWPGADDAADKLEQSQGLPPEVQKQMQDMQQALQKEQAKNADNEIKQQELALRQQELQLEAQKLEIERYKAQHSVIQAQSIQPFAGQAATEPY
jgi:hypothetical protein